LPNPQNRGPKRWHMVLVMVWARDMSSLGALSSCD
jgi:hypothetical protein